MSLIAGLASLAGGVIGAIGNAKATSAANAATDRQTEAIREGNAQAQARYDQNFKAGAPGIDYLRTQVGNDGGLTPLQQEQLNDTRRATENSLAGGGLRGSGRARVSALRKVEGNVRNQFLESNQSRAAGAAGTLASGAFGANNASAAASMNEGRALSGIYGQQGENNANRAIGDASIAANALGDAAGAFDPGLRKSRYSTGQTTSAMRAYYGS